MKINGLLTVALLTTLLSACGAKEEYTVDYLYNNDDIRAQVLADCANNKQTDTNCKNANEANERKKIEEYRKHVNR
ncbi:hypothetical protein MOMA_02585 [Moraxella macacae 0408225]|uniref:Lipoprotein n=1 Tax=Moraxella macacae 0408225 TaxID=1230338 RepID=L2F917_9GAMM|nr:EexN family lipoprotein [Moraxella macacae]ELA09256.1 hypothetical protein MOMA_02585 [Moraxella macacae 0408225]